MTRDDFAILILPHIIEKCLEHPYSGYEPTDFPKIIATSTYAIADALLEVRDKGVKS